MLVSSASTAFPFMGGTKTHPPAEEDGLEKNLDVEEESNVSERIENEGEGGGEGRGGTERNLNQDDIIDEQEESTNMDSEEQVVTDEGDRTTDKDLLENIDAKELREIIRADINSLYKAGTYRKIEHLMNYKPCEWNAKKAS